MSRDLNTYKISSPTPFLWRVSIFLVITGFVAIIAIPHVGPVFLANLSLNWLILSVAIVGIVLAIQQIALLSPGVTWINNLHDGRSTRIGPVPEWLCNLALMTHETNSGRLLISHETSQVVQDSVYGRLNSGRQVTKYTIGLLIFLGLLGTFWGLTDTVASIGLIIKTLNTSASDVNSAFENLKSSLSVPLSGMGMAFSSSLFGLIGSLIVGFIDLQVGQAHNKFHQDLELWLSVISKRSVDSRNINLVGGISASGAQQAAEILLEDVNRIALALEEDRSLRLDARQTMNNLISGITKLLSDLQVQQASFIAFFEDNSRELRSLRRTLERTAPPSYHHYSGSAHSASGVSSAAQAAPRNNDISQNTYSTKDPTDKDKHLDNKNEKSDSHSDLYYNHSNKQRS